MSETTNALSIVETLTPAVVFQRDGGVEDIISKLEADVRAIDIDVTTEKGRKHCKSVAHKVARSKTALDDMGKAVQEDAKRVVDRVNGERRIIRERLDALRDEVRAPVDEFEARETARVSGHQNLINEIEWLSRFEVEPTESAVANRQADLANYQGRDWQEFAARAKHALDTASMVLKGHAAEARDRRVKADEAAKQARLAADAEALRLERERIEREARIALEATERAKAEAERRADAERQAAARREQEIRDRAERAEREKIEAERRAEEDRKCAAEKAERDRVEAIRVERDRVAAEAAREKAEAERRAANRAHQVRINREILAAMTAIGITEDLAKALIGALARREIPHVTLAY